jgi:glycosyltransferase involved in cell wall biosynthesis
MLDSPDHSGGSTPRVTVVIPTRDRPDMVRRALASTLRQTIRDVEVLVVDDAADVPFDSPDPRVRVIRRTRRGGPCAARNEGLKAARGSWIVFLDDDDELLTDMLEVSLEAIRTSRLPAPVAVMSCVRAVDTSGAVVDVRCPPPALARGSHWSFDGRGDGRFRSSRTLVAPIDVVRSIDGFDERFPAMEDTDFCIRLNAVCSIEGLQRETYRAWIHGGPKVLSQPMSRAEGLRLTLQKHAHLFAADHHKHAKTLAAMAMGYLFAGKWSAAVVAASSAVARDPLRGRSYLQLVVCLAGPTVAMLVIRLRRALPRARVRLDGRMG